MGSNVVPGYNPILAVAEEATFGTSPTPGSTSAYAALALSTIQARLGAVQAPAVRAKQDRGLGRGMQDGFVSGRYEPQPWNVMLSMKSRAAIDDAPREVSLWKTTGFKRTVNASTSYVLSPSATPVESADFVSATLSRFLGRSPGELEYERLTGCLAQSVRIEGGDKEVMLSFTGVGQQQVAGTALSSITLANGSTTTLSVTAAESYALAPGYYICESEIILVSAPTYGGTSVTIARGQLGTSGASHTAQPLYPYVPAVSAYSGSPISEALTTTCTFDGGAFRVTGWSVDINTGLNPLPGETGSAYFQGVKANRYDVTAALNFILKGDDIRKFNKARERTSLAVSLVQGSATGGVITIALPYCELIAPEAQDNANDSIAVSAQLRVRDSTAGNDAFSITFT